jgi:segregation and condensation protein B
VNIDSLIEAILFYKGEPVAVKKLGELLAVPVGEIETGLNTLEEKLTGRGMVLVRHENTVALGTAKEASDLIEKITKEELTKDLGKAGLETLSAVLYYGPISRVEIDHIRGVNSSFILRHLMIRGLVAREQNPKDLRGFVYRPTMDLLTHLGIAKIEDLPEYDLVKNKLAEFSKEEAKEDLAEERPSESK